MPDRRIDDGSTRVIETKLEAISELVKSGFDRIDLRFDHFDDRVKRIEIDVGELREFRASVEAREALAASSGDRNFDWTKIVLALVSVLAVALAIIGQLIGGAAG